MAAAGREQDHHFTSVKRQTDHTGFQYAEVLQTPGRPLTYVSNLVNHMETTNARHQCKENGLMMRMCRCMSHNNTKSRDGPILLSVRSEASFIRDQHMFDHLPTCMLILCTQSKRREDVHRLDMLVGAPLWGQP